MEQSYIGRISLNSPVDEDSYIANLPMVRHLAEQDYIAFNKPVTFLVGENGTGKSTLLEAIAVAYGFNAEGGSRNFNFSTAETHSALCSHLTISKRAYPKDGFFLRAESFYNAASYIDTLYRDISPVRYGGKSLHAQSHGESFLALVTNRFGGNGLYLLDEPEAALSPSRLMALMVHINNLVKQKSQFIIATHSPILMTFPDSEILQLSEHGIESVNFRDTEHYQLTRRFLEDPERMLGYLFEE